VTFDLGEARRLRNEEEKSLVVTGADGEVEAKYRIVAEPPVQFFDAGVESHFDVAFRSLFVDEADADDFMQRYKPSLLDLADLLKELFPGLGANMGERLASGASSTRSGTR
jgi:hypothetical protein